MYYPDEVVGEVLRSNDIVDIISPYVKLKRSGANYFGLCPFHNEKSPSFSVSREKQIFYCFGCGAGGNALTFLMKYENASFGEAMQMLADRSGITLPSVNYSEEAKKRDQKREELLSINKEAATYYFHLLRSEKGAVGMRYLLQRGLTEETMRIFGLGFANGSANDLTAHLRKKGFSDEAILESGVAAFDERSGLHDKFWNRVMFPIQDVTGRVIGFGGRVMGDAKPKYLNSPETPVFDKSRNLYGLSLARRSRAGHFILCEGYMDVIAMHQAGFSQAVASLGTSFTEGQAAVLKRYVQDVILSYDSDTAGTTAALRNMEILQKAGIGCRVLDLTPYKDPDEFIKNAGKEAFAERIRDAENAFFFKIRMKEKEYRMDDPAQRTRFYREIARALCGFADALERENYLKAIAAKYFIGEEELRKAVASYSRVGGEEVARRPRPALRSAAGEASAKKQEEAQLKNEALLLTHLAEDPEFYRLAEPYLSADDFSEGISKRAAEGLFRQLNAQEGNQPVNVSAIIASFETEEEQQAAAGLFQQKLSVRGAPGTDEDRESHRVYLDVACAVKRASIARLAESAQDETTLERIIQSRKALKALSALAK